MLKINPSITAWSSLRDLILSERPVNLTTVSPVLTRTTASPDASRTVAANTNKKIYDSMPAKYQEVIDQRAAEASAWQKDIVRKENEAASVVPAGRRAPRPGRCKTGIAL